jgi:hypothetical protein
LQWQSVVARDIVPSDEEVIHVKPLPASERRQIFLAQQDAARRMREDLLAPPRVQDDLGAPRRRTWLIATIAASMLLGGGLLLGEVVSFEVPSSLLDVVWPRL